MRNFYEKIRAEFRGERSAYVLKKTAACALVAAVVVLFTACVNTSTSGSQSTSAEGSAQTTGTVVRECTDISDELHWDEREKTRDVQLEYAKNFSVEYFDFDSGSDETQEYRLITTHGTVSEDRFLVVPSGMAVPADLPGDIVTLNGFADNIYIASSGSMDHFCKMDALDTVKLSGTKADGWYIDEAKQAMEDGSVLYAGKYNAPDYELILDNGCRLAVENTMIYHAPKVKEQLEENGIPVLVDFSSYEEHPLGRSEWIKLYGALTGREDDAEKAFAEEVEKLDAVLDELAETSNSEEVKTVAFFYIAPSGGVNVRKSDDYVAEMIQMAGGEYVPASIDDDGKSTGTATIQMEEFYAQAKDADYLIYNSNIEEDVTSIESLIAKNSLLADFKAVQNGNVYLVGRNMYQEVSSSGTIILDIRKMLDGRDDETEILHKLEEGE